MTDLRNKIMKNTFQKIDIHYHGGLAKSPL